MFFICRSNEFLDDVYDEEKKYDFGILNKQEFNCLTDDEKIDYCYGITKGFENQYTNKSQDDDPYLFDWILEILREKKLYKELFYTYLSRNCKEEFNLLLSRFQSENDEKFEAAYEIWDETTDEFGLHHFYLFGINEIYVNQKYFSILLDIATQCNKDYDEFSLLREKKKAENIKRKGGIYNDLIKKNRSNWDEFIQAKNISYPPSVRIFPKGLTDNEQQAFKKYVELIYWNKELKSEKVRRKTFKDYPDLNF